MKNYNPETQRTDTSPVKQRLHIVSLIFFIGGAVKNFIYPLAALLISYFVRNGIEGIWSSGIIALAALLIIVAGYISWLRFTYSVQDGMVNIESGVFVRKNVWVSSDRVQSVDLTAGVLHRMFGILKLQIQTAGGNQAEVILNGISKAESNRIQEALLRKTQPDVHAAANTEEPVVQAPAEQGANARPDADEKLQLTGRNLFIYSITSGTIGIVLAVIGAAYSQLHKWLNQALDLDHMTWEQLTLWKGTLFAAGLLLAAWIIAVFITIQKEYGFTLERTGGRLKMERGLLERKEVSIKLRRIQAIQLQKNLLRRPFGFVSVYAVIAGYSGKDDKSALLFPLIREQELDAFLQRFVPHLKVSQDWETLSGKALTSYLWPSLLVSALITGLTLSLLPGPWIWLALALSALMLLYSWLQYKETAWSIQGDQLAIRYGAFNRCQALVPKRKIQWHSTSQHFFQRRKQLASLKVALPSGKGAAKYSILHLPEETAIQLKQWITQRHG
ncbi:PH domain-containing protein [Paenibacillus pinihumi]|uniref:PH domain-containing protein n=1 Tax=Paenibacillus pinihumi TaxID=669462 RepID=UPI00041B4372|nr:PH domain-containing protein [Paenibacillus pinihumi]